MWREIRKKDRKSFVSSENSRTFAPAFEIGSLRKEFFERFTQTEVVQEASTFRSTWVRRNKPFQFLNLDSRSEQIQNKTYTVESLILAQDERQLQA